MLCHIVTGLRHLVARLASMRLSQASVAEMQQDAVRSLHSRAYNESPPAFGRAELLGRRSFQKSSMLNSEK